jgi:hypothetical protein
LENLTAYLLAYTLGNISPKNNNKKVIITTCIMNPKAEGPEKLRSFDVINAEIITIPMFIKLLATRIVASNLSGIPSNLITDWSVFNFDLLNLFNSAGDREKYATSDPDTKAEDISKNNTITKATKISNEIGLKVIPILAHIVE